MDRVVLVGQSLGGLTVAWAARQYPELFGRVVSSSMAAWWPGDDHGGLSGAQVVDAYQRGETAMVRFFLEAGSRERELLASVQAYRDVLDEKGYEVTYREYEGGHDLACWRGGVADGLVALLR
jgi:enterochelin esterase family protein